MLYEKLYRREQENELNLKIKARDYDIKQTVYLNKELEKKLTNLSIDAHYSSMIFESVPKFNEKAFDKSRLSDSRETNVFSDPRETLLENPMPVQENHCCNRCLIF